MATDDAPQRDLRPPPGSLGARRAVAAVRYGALVPAEDELRLCGNVAGRRVLVLGAGDGESPAAFAVQGAHVIVVDPSAAALDAARRRSDAEGVGIEPRHGDLAELAFARADSVDLVFSAGSLGAGTDLRRVFRQVHRVLRPESPFVFALPHPAWAAIDDHDDPAPTVRRAWSDGALARSGVADVFTALMRTGLRVDTLLEPGPRAGTAVPAAAHVLPTTLVVRARKEGT